MLTFNLRRIVKMIGYSKSQRINVPQDVMFNVVRNTKDYYTFIPWCRRSDILKEISANQNYTQLTISFNDFKQIKYTSHVKITTENNTKEIKSICQQSPLKYLQSVWTISEHEKESCQVNYSLDFQFQSLVYQLTSSVFLEFMGKTMMQTFIKRAKNIHQQNKKMTIDQLIKVQQASRLVQQKMILKEILQRNPHILNLYVKNDRIKKQIDQIKRRLSGTDRFRQKLIFEIGNIMSQNNQN